MTRKMCEVEVVNSKDGISAGGSGWRTSPPPDPASISEECFSGAEEAAEQVLNCVHPTLDSEEKRTDVADYIQGLVKSHLNCEVVSYGSVPLKTYLPDGDIDLTVLKGPNAEESLAHDLFALLQDEEQNEYSEYQVKDTQFIDAEVKLVKCLVQNIVIDISFNQLGGLSTLCFLEQVDRFIGRNHLFKRSIILVKTWCYYESRILGAHHGLISTYALEILVLYIFHHFHSSLSGPLAVLYRYLDYYSQFDWENYCISLKGPVFKSSLPDIVVKMPESGRNNLLLSEDFLGNCMELFSVPFRGHETNQKAFQTKHLNIIDPLKENNNLGRSVHRGNFYRIQSAFKYGAHKLGQVLLRPRDNIADEICAFFANTLARHEHQCRSKDRHVVLEFVDEEESLSAPLFSPVELFSDDDVLLNSSVSDFDNESVGVEQTPIVDVGTELYRYSIGEVSQDMAYEACDSVDGFLVSGHYIAGGKYGLATTNSSLRNGTSDYISSSHYSSSLSENHFHRPNCSFSKSSAENGSSDAQPIDVACDREKFGFNSWLENGQKLVEMNNTHRWCMDNSKAVCITGSSSIPKVNILENAYIDFREIDSMSTDGESEAFNPLADLSGDYDSNIRSLLCGQLTHGCALSTSIACNSSSPPSRIQNKNPWDIVHQSMPLRQNEFSHMNSHTISTDHSMYPCADSVLLGTAFNFEGIRKTRGTGTFFPHMNLFYMERPSHGRGRNKVSGYHSHLHRHGHSNDIYPVGESNVFENGHEIQHSRRKYQGRRRRSDVRLQSPHSVGGGNESNGYLSGPCRVEFGSIGNLGEELIAGSARVRGSTDGATVKEHGSTAVMMRERVAGQSIHLKNEDEFPPLCQ